MTKLGISAEERTLQSYTILRQARPKHPLSLPEPGSGSLRKRYAEALGQRGRSHLCPSTDRTYAPLGKAEKSSTYAGLSRMPSHTGVPKIV